MSPVLFFSCSLSRSVCRLFCSLYAFTHFLFLSLWLCLPNCLYNSLSFSPCVSFPPSICLVCLGVVWRTFAKSQTLLGFVYSSFDGFITPPHLRVALVLTKLTCITYMLWYMMMKYAVLEFKIFKMQLKMSKWWHTREHPTDSVTREAYFDLHSVKKSNPLRSSLYAMQNSMFFIIFKAIYCHLFTVHLYLCI